MRISYRVFLVGGIPIVLAATVAVAALLLLNEADRARSGAVLAGAIYRNLLAARTARDDYVEAAPAERARFAELFHSYSDEARTDLTSLAGVVRDRQHRAATAEAGQALQRYGDSMSHFEAVTVRNDGLVATMAKRADTLVRLTDEARERQHKSNADIVTSLTENDSKLRLARDIVDRAQEFGAAIAALELLQAREDAGAGRPLSPNGSWSFGLARMRAAAANLSSALEAAGHGPTASEMGRLLIRYETSFAPVRDATLAADLEASTTLPGQALADWNDRLLKIYSTEQRAIHDQVADLLTYSVQAHETEQATQNIAIQALKLGGRAARALSSRNTAAAGVVLAESQALGDTVAALPITPLIQTEMIDALDEWRKGLGTTIDGLNEQNRILAEMDSSAARMVEGARVLDQVLTLNAKRIGELVRNMVIFGVVVGLLIGSVTGIAVARSITRPLRRLQQRMMELAAGAHAEPIVDFERRDELGDMARATNVFITEIGRRETALRDAKERADAALAELQRTQAELIQAEKLASLGQLVAGVAHEINTPLGIALTTATLLGDEAGRFAEAAGGGRLQRSTLERFVGRMREGTQLLFSNLTRAADLVHSFKQVAADQASGERRRFEMNDWLQDLFTSLSPVLRKTNIQVMLDCPPGVTVDTFPGALGQVLTNLVTNAIAHAYEKGEPGRLSVNVSEPRPDRVRIVFADQGRGIPPENLGKVFDPFFTTGRSAGSTGLGLHIVYNLVTSRLQGRIDLHSIVDHGTRFTIDLPKTAAELRAEAAPDRRLEFEEA
jgi:signal transduction histidine kinase